MPKYFFPVEGGEYAFVVVIKHLIDFDGNKLSRLSRWVCNSELRIDILGGVLKKLCNSLVQVVNFFNIYEKKLNVSV